MVFRREKFRRINEIYFYFFGKYLLVKLNIKEQVGQEGQTKVVETRDTAV